MIEKRFLDLRLNCDGEKLKSVIYIVSFGSFAGPVMGEKFC
jgi:hypothetical protein